MHVQSLDNKIILWTWNYLLGFKQITNSELCFSSQWKYIEKDRKVLQAWNVSLYVTIIIWVSEYYSLHCKLWEFVFINCNWELKERAKIFVFLKKFLTCFRVLYFVSQVLWHFRMILVSSIFNFVSFLNYKNYYGAHISNLGYLCPLFILLKKKQCFLSSLKWSYIKNM